VKLWDLAARRETATLEGAMFDGAFKSFFDRANSSISTKVVATAKGTGKSR
jgi:hypothetical protein